MENIKLICKDCKKEFDFTVGEQRFYEEKGFAAPIRCKECRDAKKARNLEREEVEKRHKLKNKRERTEKQKRASKQVRRHDSNNERKSLFQENITI